MGIHQQTETFRWPEEVKAKFEQITVALSRFNDTPAQVHRSIIRIVWDMIFVRDERRVNEIVRMLQGLHCGTLQDDVAPAAMGTPKFGPQRVSLGGETERRRPRSSASQTSGEAAMGWAESSFSFPSLSRNLRLWSLT